MRTPRSIPLVTLLLAAGLCLPASAQVGGAGGERKNDTEETRRNTGGVRGAGESQRGDQTGGAREQTGGQERDGQRDGERQGGRGRGGETPPTPSPTPAEEAPERERPVQEKRPTPQGERPAPARQDAQQGEAGRQRPGLGQGTGAPGNDKGQGAERSANRALSRGEVKKFMEMLAAEESTHRERQARLKRLMELARTEEDETRIAEVQGLAQRESQRHQRELERMERFVGSGNFRIGVQKLKQHQDARKRAAGAGGADPERPVGERPVGERQGDARENAGDGGAGTGNGTGGGRRGDQGGGGR